jgi:hypothetical protein
MRTGLIAAFAALGFFVAASAKAETLQVTFVVNLQSGATATATWDQDSNPTPINSDPNPGDAVTEIPISNFTSDIFATPAPLVAFYRPAGEEYQFTLDEGVNWIGLQLYTGSEAAPQFSVGVYNGTIEGLGDTSTLSFAALSGGPAAPEPATWSLTLLGFASLGALYRSARRRALAT